ncbi:MAG TPA: sensor histidine kinase [Casimicrobiaceae bacterium]|nr:sensor histidine kinase [Casimicrobiaceae bacterium]
MCVTSATKLQVQDTGCGIPASDIPEHFFALYGARAAGESGREGLGLGLAIAKRICDHYGWTLPVQSELGHGTKVSVEFTRPRHLFEAGR